MAQLAHPSSLHSQRGSSSHLSNNMASSLPSLFMKHTRSNSLEKQSATLSSGHPQAQLQSSHYEPSRHVNGATNDPLSASSPGLSAPSGSGSSSFFRNGDIVYDHGPPVTPPLPSVGNRNYTVLKEVGDGSFGTVWLADWHSPLASVYILPTDEAGIGENKLLILSFQPSKRYRAAWS